MHRRPLQISSVRLRCPDQLRVRVVMVGMLLSSPEDHTPRFGQRSNVRHNIRPDG